MNLNSKIVLFVLLGSKSCSGLQLAYSADLFRAVLVASRLMTHFTASGGYRIKLQINYRSSVGQGSCVFVGGGGRVLQVLPVIPVRESHRASVSSFTEQAAAIVIM